MEYREFGRTGAKVSAIGMGTYYDAFYITAALLLRYHHGRDKKLAALRKGFELGINLIDTAEIYQTEPLVGQAIRGYKRDELFIVTKIWPSHLRYDDVLKTAQKSLKRLQCSYIDLYQIHWPNPKVPIGETMRAMEKLVDEGKIRYLGVSNFSLAETRKAEEALSKNELASNQVEYSLKVRDIEEDLLPYCERNGIAILAYRPVAHGELARPKAELKAVIDEISQRHGGRTPSQMAINWLLNKSKLVFPIPRASRPERVIENVGSTGWSMDDEDMEKLEKAVSR